MDFKHLAVPNSCNRFNVFQFEVKLGSRSKSQDTSSHWTFCNSMLASAFQSCCLPLHVRSFLFREFQEANPSSKDKWHKDLLRPSTTQHPKDSQSTARKSAANGRTPSVTSSEPLPKRPENPSEATAVVVGRVHRGPRRDQLLDHGGMVFPSRKMQRRPASGAEDATPTAGRLRLPSRNKAYSHGMFLRAVGQIFLEIGHRSSCTWLSRQHHVSHVYRKYFMISWITLDYPSAAKSGHVWQKNARRNARAVRWEGAGLKHRARCGLVAGMKVIGQVFLPRETYAVHYTVKRKVCAGLKPIWLVQVWKQRDLESIVLDLRVRTCPPISAFTQDWNPPTLFFNITSSGPYPWSILTDQSSFIVLLLCGQRWYSESKRSEPANLLWHFHQKN